MGSRAMPCIPDAMHADGVHIHDRGGSSLKGFHGLGPMCVVGWMQREAHPSHPGFRSMGAPRAAAVALHHISSTI